jgi:hypothetical protein
MKLVHYNNMLRRAKVSLFSGLTQLSVIDMYQYHGCTIELKRDLATYSEI